MQQCRIDQSGHEEHGGGGAEDDGEGGAEDEEGDKLSLVCFLVLTIFFSCLCLAPESVSEGMDLIC